MCRAGNEPHCTQGRHRCPYNDYVQNAARGRRRAVTNGVLKYHEPVGQITPEKLAALDELPEDYWRTVIYDEDGNIIGSKASTTASRSAYIAATTNLKVIRAGLTWDARAAVQAAAAQHPLAEQARQLGKRPSGRPLTPAQQASLDGQRTRIAALGAAAIPAHAQYLIELEEHFQGRRPPVMSPEAAAKEAEIMATMSADARGRYNHDQLKQLHAWEVKAGKCRTNFQQWNIAREVAQMAANGTLRGSRSKSFAWETVSKADLGAAIKAGRVDETRIDEAMKVRLRARWAAETAAAAGNTDAGTAVEEAQRFNSMPQGRNGFWAIPVATGKVILETRPAIRPYRRIELDMRGKDLAQALDTHDDALRQVQAAA